jgi:Zn-dependent peptidase ImmA (M78 family)
MKFLRDPLGRPIKRLYFKTEELDERCERIIRDFMHRRSGGFRLPIPTDEIVRMIEAEADDLDMYANLPEGQDGFTEFFVDRKPRVQISRRLSDPRYENRLRTTLGHEYGHVWFHAPLWRESGRDSDRRPAARSWRCERDTIVTASENDWMEWQAAYISGALLMPRTNVIVLTNQVAKSYGGAAPVVLDATAGRDLIQQVRKRFQVSEQAAQVRLSRLGLLSEE